MEIKNLVFKSETTFDKGLCELYSGDGGPTDPNSKEENNISINCKVTPGELTTIYVNKETYNNIVFTMLKDNGESNENIHIEHMIDFDVKEENEPININPIIANNIVTLAGNIADKNLEVHNGQCLYKGNRKEFTVSMIVDIRAISMPEKIEPIILKAMKNLKRLENLKFISKEIKNASINIQNELGKLYRNQDFDRKLFLEYFDKLRHVNNSVGLYTEIEIVTDLVMECLYKIRNDLFEQDKNDIETNNNGNKIVTNCNGIKLLIVEASITEDENNINKPIGSEEDIIEFIKNEDITEDDCNVGDTIQVTNDYVTYEEPFLKGTTTLVDSSFKDNIPKDEDIEYVSHKYGYSYKLVVLSK